MSTHPDPVPPASEPPKKPIEKRTLGLLLVGLLTVGVTLTSFVSILTTSQPRSAQPGEVQMPTAKPVVSSFAGDVDRAKEIIARNAETASQVAALASALHAQLPPCDPQMREKLKGRYFVLHSNTPDHPDANLECGSDNQWVALPPTVGQVEPETRAQAAAETKASETGALSASEKRKLRLEAAYRSSAIPLHFADNESARTPSPEPVERTSTSAALPVPAPAASGSPLPNGSSLSPAASESTQREQLGVQLSHYTGPRYPVFQGRIIEGLLANRLMGDQGGPLKVQVSTPVYSQDGQRLLIPPGSVLLGEAARVEASGQQRLAVLFHRIIMPDGWSFLLEPTKGLDQQGAAGLTGRINRHLVSLIATAVMVGAIEGLADFTVCLPVRR